MPSSAPRRERSHVRAERKCPQRVRFRTNGPPATWARPNVDSDPLPSNHRPCAGRSMADWLEALTAHVTKISPAGRRKPAWRMLKQARCMNKARILAWCGDEADFTRYDRPRQSAPTRHAWNRASARRSRHVETIVAQARRGRDRRLAGSEQANGVGLHVIKSNSRTSSRLPLPAASRGACASTPMPCTPIGIRPIGRAEVQRQTQLSSVRPWAFELWHNTCALETRIHLAPIRSTDRRSARPHRGIAISQRGAPGDHGMETRQKASPSQVDAGMTQRLNHSLPVEGISLKPGSCRWPVFF